MSEQLDIYSFIPEEDIFVMCLNGFKGFYVARKDHNSFDGLFIYHWEEDYDKAQEWRTNFIEEWYK